MEQSNTTESHAGTLAPPMTGAIANNDVDRPNITPVKNKRRSTYGKFICPYCSRDSFMIWVHGHYQCMKCKTVIESCCESY